MYSMGNSTISMAIFNSYVSLPEGIEAMAIEIVDLPIQHGDVP